MSGLEWQVACGEVFEVKDWSGQKVLILGAARQGTALARYLARRGAQVILNDRRPADELRPTQEALADLEASLRWVCGGHPLEALEGVDLVCVSGGVPLTLPLIQEALARGIPLSNDSQVFLEAAPCKVVGITGSAGKTTTTTLVGRMADEGSRSKLADSRIRRVFVGGNIGTPLLALVDEMQPEDLAVMELSSFQLEIMTRAPQVAAVLNVTPNHLDRHGTMEAYVAAKAHILDHQSPMDIAILGRDDPGAWGLRARVKGRLLSFGFERSFSGEGTYLRGDDLYLWDGDQERWLMSRREVQLRGAHNLSNVLAACAIAAAVDLPAEAMRVAVRSFRGVPHRLEFVRRWRGVDWYNDSIATAPERAMAAIRSFEEPLVLLAGGRDKDLPWDDFAALVRQRVDHLILFGEAADKIAHAIGEGFPYTVCANLKEAVQVAAQVVQAGDVVLLSPGGTSFDEFRDFEERGECFKQLVMQLGE